MNCYVSAVFGLGMLAASFFTMSCSQEQRSKLRKTFSDDLNDIYDNIVIERRNIYFQGLLLGFFVAYFATTQIQFINTFHRVTFFLAVSLPIAVVYYFLMPKSDYMLNHLKTQEENKAWLDVYRTMQQRYFLGVLFGMLAAIPLGYALCATQQPCRGQVYVALGGAAALDASP